MTNCEESHQTARPDADLKRLTPALPVAHSLSVSTLQGKGLRRRFGHRCVVDGVDITARSGEIVGLLGPNGAGKTVTFSMLTGTLRPSEGCVLLDGEDITALPLHLRARRGIGYLQQQRAVFHGLTALENVAAVLEQRGERKRPARQHAVAILNTFGLERVADTRAGRLSGGEQRRLELARSLAIEPRFLLLDEPFAGIDPLAVESLHRQLLELRRTGIGIILSDHNVKEALSLCDRAYVLFAGRVLAEGTSEELCNNPLVRQRFLGEEFDSNVFGVVDGADITALSESQSR